MFVCSALAGCEQHSKLKYWCIEVLVFHMGDPVAGIYQAEVRHLSHASILLIMRLLEVMIPNITFKFGANNFNFIRVRLGQVRLG